MDAALRAETSFALAQALWRSGGDRARARTLPSRRAELHETGAPGVARRGGELAGQPPARLKMSLTLGQTPQASGAGP